MAAARLFAMLFLPFLATLAAAHPHSDLSFEHFMGPAADRQTEMKNKVIKVEEGQLPPWLVGDYYAAGPHALQIGKTRVDHYLDGLGVLHKWHFDVSGDCTWTAKIIDSTLWQTSQKLGQLGPCVQFKETVPSRNFSFWKNLGAVNDNDYVVQLPLGDKGFIGLTDDAFNSIYDEELHHRLIQWHDKLVPALHQAGSVAHAVKHAGSDDIIGLMTVSPEYPFAKPFHVLYKIEVSDPTVRKQIAKVQVKTPSYQHSFGLSDRHAIICEHGWVIDSVQLLKGKMASEASTFKYVPTKLHVVDLQDGNFKTYEADPFICIHFANVVETGTGLLFDMPVWEAPHADMRCNPYDAFDFQKYDQRDTFRNQCMNRLKRHEIDFATGKVSTEVLDAGWFEYPVFNQDFRGKKTCFLYLTEWYHNDTAVFGAMAMVKYNTCEKRREAVFYERARYPSEPHFVANPDGTAEDDGVIVTPIMDGAHAERHAHFAVLSAKDLSVLARLPLGDTLPHTVHGWFKFRAKASMPTTVVV